jgi:transcriptional regulator
VTHLGRPHAWTDEAEMRAFVARESFAQVTCAVGDRPLAAHAPVSLADDGSVRFHLARNNPVAGTLDGRPVLASVVGPHGYISPDWYGTIDQVPTWNYTLVEVAGIARRLTEDELRGQVDAVSAAQEALLMPKPAWTSAKMDPHKLRLMLRAIVGFAIDAPAFSGARKLGQNKSAGEIEGAILGLRACGASALADAMETAR